jgi:hypothetical protein
MQSSTPTPTVNATTRPNNGETSIRVITFSEKNEEWESWREKFLVRSSIRGYEELVLGDVTIPPTHEEDGTKGHLQQLRKTSSNPIRKDMAILSFPSTVQVQQEKLYFQ